MQVLRIFLIEAALIGTVGGAIGITLGALLAKLIELAGRAYMGSGFVTLITPKLLLFSLLFALLVGVISGMYPAYRASRLEPVEALRYE
ncbi:MAG: FtsX-like permease family protein [Euryarchaeota archaeon]|nr:FtsX-like permease family protein [Euryarchaeota archaeon]